VRSSHAGQLDAIQFGGGLHADPFSEPTKRAEAPTRLVLPERIVKIGCVGLFLGAWHALTSTWRRCGRAHATALSSTTRVWVFASWGRPYVLTTPLLSTAHAFSTPLQVESGWMFSAVLTHGGDVYVLWPSHGEFAELRAAHHAQRDDDPAQRVRDGDGVVYCQPWDVATDPWAIHGPATALPRLGEDEEVGERIVKIAAGDEFLIGLTEGGHVVKVNVRADDRDRSRRPRWEYVSAGLLGSAVSTAVAYDDVTAATVQRGPTCSDASGV
jgi:SCF-associated factor 1